MNMQQLQLTCAQYKDSPLIEQSLHELHKTLCVEIINRFLKVFHVRI